MGVRSRGCEEGGVADDEFGGYFGDDAMGEVGGAGGVERDGEDAAEETAEECGDPVGGVFAPEDDTLAGEDAATFELGGEPACELGEVAVGGGVAPNAAVGYHRRLGGVGAEVLDEAGQVGTHER